MARRARAAALALATDYEGEAEALGVMLLTDLQGDLRRPHARRALDRKADRAPEGDA